jgi:hypothetical protein
MRNEKSTRSRNRTGTALRPLVFETNASTSSAIRAYCALGLQKYKMTIILQIIDFDYFSNTVFLDYIFLLFDSISLEIQGISIKLQIIYIFNNDKPDLNVWCFSIL